MLPCCIFLNTKSLNIKLNETMHLESFITLPEYFTSVNKKLIQLLISLISLIRKL